MEKNQGNVVEEVSSQLPRLGEINIPLKQLEQIDENQSDSDF